MCNVGRQGWCWLHICLPLFIDQQLYSPNVTQTAENCKHFLQFFYFSHVWSARRIAWHHAALAMHLPHLLCHNKVTRNWLYKLATLIKLNTFSEYTAGIFLERLADRLISDQIYYLMWTAKCYIIVNNYNKNRKHLWMQYRSWLEFWEEELSKPDVGRNEVGRARFSALVG